MSVRVKRIVESLLILFFACFVNSSFLLYARPINSFEAKTIACRFFESRSTLRGEVNNLVLVKAPVLSHSLRSDDIQNKECVHLYYIFNRGNLPGFVIVSGDDRLPEVLGYGLSESYSEDDMPCNLKEYLQLFDAYVARMIMGGESIPLRKSSCDRSQSPLLKNIAWNQGYPWNSETPMIEGRHCPVGCVATATAQIMRYYKWPEKGEGSHSYKWRNQRLSVNYDVPYDWDSMPERFDHVHQAKPNEIKALGTLCAHVGMAEDMLYTLSGSGAYDVHVIRALRDHFHYDKGIYLYHRNLTTQQEWESRIRAELDKKRPVLYSGYGTNGGHAFVCDGYDERGLFHINWGWGGLSDGYFPLNALNPPELGTGEGMGGFNYGQSIVLNFVPDYDFSSQMKPTEVECWGLTQTTSDGQVQCRLRVSMQQVRHLDSEIRLVVENASDPTDRYVTPTQSKSFMAPTSYDVDMYYILQEKGAKLQLSKPNEKYIVYAESKAEDGAFHRLRKVYGCNDHLILHSDASCNIRYFEKPPISLTYLDIKDEAQASLVSFEKSKVECSIHNMANLEALTDVLLYFYKAGTKHLLFSTNYRCVFPAVTVKEFSFDIDRLGLYANQSVDIVIAIPKYKMIKTLLSNVFVSDPAKHRDGYLVEIDTTMLEEEAYPIEFSSPCIAGFSLRNLNIHNHQKRLNVVMSLAVPRVGEMDAHLIPIDTCQIDAIWNGQMTPLRFDIGPELIDSISDFTVKYGKAYVECAIYDSIYHRIYDLIPLRQRVFLRDKQTVFNQVKIEDTEGGKIFMANWPEGLPIPQGRRIYIGCYPDFGYELDKVYLNDQELSHNSSIIVNQDCSLRAEFKKRMAKVRLIKEGEGELFVKGYDYKSEVDLPIGSHVMILARAKDSRRYKLSSLTANGADILDKQEFILIEDTNVKAIFEDITSSSCIENSLVKISSTEDGSITIRDAHPKTLVILYDLRGYKVGEYLTDDCGNLQIKGLRLDSVILKIGDERYKLGGVNF